MSARILSFLLGAAVASGAWFLLGNAGSLTARFAMDTAAAPTQAPADEALRPAYLVVLGEVRDRDRFMNDYTAKLPPLYARHGGEYLAVGRNFEVLEGKGDFKSYVISKWPSMEAGRAFWNSPEYDALRRARIEGDWGRFDVFLIEGLPTAAP